ncbi:hypothetical protein PTSG_07842 [Salpingoeca rosetta]|uniref:Store-operated calcium entry-associated regulatory factor n=1 Tax=Salpingoeca rosetta (strain ATCC 50818 / BSB-021) TaxID=946362 RepID=F2UGH6_SALR5|nr:uncharacterized protein PTSG_07842 [Salpingoeca rosetta]EGD75726.1 hypothetical protein PTSG_07842 [Salpingoeca rosetta]|eukprot:XP_004991647.1 hypothetical protein PTSG_07842 [Salpingoeca rosetta]
MSMKLAGTAMLAAALVLTMMACVGHAHWSHQQHSHHAKKALLKDVSVLTLSSDQMTTGRRSRPVPQMTCVDGTANCHRDVLPTVMQCRNVGWDGNDVQWQCTAELDNSVKLGRTDVTCEGYDYPDDPYILAGSCGVEYTLDSTGNYGSRHGKHHHHHHHAGHASSGGGSNFLLILVLVFLAYQMYKWCSRGRVAQEMYGEGAMDPNDFGPGGRFHNTAPPPGYPGSGPGCAPPSYQQAMNQGAAAQGGWNFWHGFGLGGLLGYLAPRRRAYYGYGMQPGWGGGYRQNNYYYNTGASARRSPSPPRSSGTHASTGYGGTRRR